jgi:hypothetical protein
MINLLKALKRAPEASARAERPFKEAAAPEAGDGEPLFRFNPLKRPKSALKAGHGARQRRLPAFLF